jgi:Flp pilus assembly protein TadG
MPEKSQSLVEFAITLPLFLLLLALLIEAGFLFHDYHELEQTTYSIARFAAKGTELHLNQPDSTYDVAKGLGVTAATHSMRVAYVTLTDINTTSVIDYTQVMTYGVPTQFPDVNLATQHQSYIDYTLESGKYVRMSPATWVVVDLVYYRPWVFVPLNDVTRLHSSAVFRVAYVRDWWR